MVEIKPLTGYRPTEEAIARFVTTAYDVIKKGSKVEYFFEENPDSLYHVILGDKPIKKFNEFKRKHIIIPDENCLLVYQQLDENNGIIRIGLLAAAEASDYSKGEIIDHEEVNMDKVYERLELLRKTGYSFEPGMFLTKSHITPILEEIVEKHKPLYDFTSNFINKMESELHGTRHRIFRIEADSRYGVELTQLIKPEPLYIADYHHRYKSLLSYSDELKKQLYSLAYIAETIQFAKNGIQAYNRVINGTMKFKDIKDKLDLVEVSEFKTPPKHHFCIYWGGKSYLLRANHIPDNPQDVIDRLDCSILEREFYQLIGIKNEMTKNPEHFDYYPEFQLPIMKSLVDSGKFDIAVALHQVSLQDVLDVANARLLANAKHSADKKLSMPSKSTYFAPKVVSGTFILKH